MSKKLKTAEAVVETLGGDERVAKMVGTTPKAVGNWRNFGWFPADTYYAMQRALKRRRCSAGPELWRMAMAGKRIVNWRGKVPSADAAMGERIRW